MSFSRYTAIFVAIFGMAILLVSCSTPERIKKQLYTGSGQPEKSARGHKLDRSRAYSIDGITYYPLESAEGFTETGLASWYGPKFHGKKTANGETYDMHGITAAHKTLPMNTVVRVKAIDSGNEIVVRINDRGPFVSGRIIDLSRGAAKKLGILDAGTAKVTIEALAAGKIDPDSNDAYASEPVPDFKHGQFAVQVGAFRERARAEALLAKITPPDGAKARLVPANTNIGKVYRVQLGPITDLDSAQKIAKSMNDDGYPGAFVYAE